MPAFRLFGRRDEPSNPAAAEPPTPPGTVFEVGFDALTEEWRLVGVMRLDRRLSDVLNRRVEITIEDVRWAPADGSGPFAPVPGLQTMDPYDLVVIVTDDASLPPADAAARLASRLHKVSYDVALEAPPFRVVGTVHLFPGAGVERLMERQTELFLPVTDARVFHGSVALDFPPGIVALVNQAYLRGVVQVDLATWEPLAPFPGASAGEVEGPSAG